MEIILRCALADRPGRLALLAGAIGETAGDIQAVEVIEHLEGRAYDDLIVVVEPEALGALVEAVRALPDIELVHAGPSRGHPGDAVTRLAVTLGALLDGAMTVAHATETLVGGLLRATSVELLPPGDWPDGKPDGPTLVLPYDGGALVIRREYRFTPTERQRAEALVGLLLRARALAQPQSESASSPASGVG